VVLERFFLENCPAGVVRLEKYGNTCFEGDRWSGVEGESEEEQSENCACETGPVFRVSSREESETVGLR